MILGGGASLTCKAHSAIADPLPTASWGLLQRELGNATTRKNQLVVNGYEYKTASESIEHPNNRPNVGMSKRNLSRANSEYASGEGESRRR